MAVVFVVGLNIGVVVGVVLDGIIIDLLLVVVALFAGVLFLFEAGQAAVFLDDCEVVLVVGVLLSLSFLLLFLLLVSLLLLLALLPLFLVVGAVGDEGYVAIGDLVVVSDEAVLVAVVLFVFFVVLFGFGACVVVGLPSFFFLLLSDLSE